MLIVASGNPWSLLDLSDIPEYNVSKHKNGESRARIMWAISAEHERSTSETWPAVWLSGKHIRLIIRQPWVWVLFWPLAGFVLGCPNLKTSGHTKKFVHSQLGSVWIFILFLIITWVESRVPVNLLYKLSALSTNKQTFNPLTLTHGMKNNPGYL